jgi:aminopeptidase N
MRAIAVGSLVAVTIVAGCTADTTTSTTTSTVEGTTTTTLAPTTTGPSTTSTVEAAGIDAGDGLGDSLYPLLGNEGYDVEHVQLHLDTTPWFERRAALEGRITLTIVPSVALDSFVVDAGSLVVRTVEVDGEPAPYEPGDQLRIDPDAVLVAGAPADVTIGYAAPVPASRQLSPGDGGLLPTETGLFAVGEPTGATTWRPANDHPSDKATYEITIVTPADVVGVTGGVLTATEAVPGGTARTFVLDDPVASYLVPLVVDADLELIDHADDGTPDVRDWVDASLGLSESLLGTQVAMVDFFEGIFGPYPFPTAGAAVVDRAFWGAIETQTLSTFAPNAVQDFVIAHEIAHQWVGNSVSVADWSDIWLNEGFATYAEWLWMEEAGVRSVEESAQRAVSRVEAAGVDFGPGEPPPDDLFNRIVYERGGLTLHALRSTIGDAAFFEVLAEWTDRFAYGNAGTADFVDLAEEVSGTDLGALFDDWLFGAMPELP